MRFEIKLNTLKDHLSKITHSVQSVASRIEFTGVLITVYENSVVFEGRNDWTDTKIEETSLTSVKIIEPGRVLIKANILNELIQKMQGDVVTFSKIDESIVTITSEDSNYKITPLNDENYTKSTYMSEFENPLVIKGSSFIQAVSKVVFAGYENHQKAILQGVHINVKDGVISATACDSRRIASYSENIGGSEELNKIIPIKVVRELIKLLPSTEVKFYFSHNKGIVVSEKMINQFSLFEGTYPTFNNFYNVEMYKSKLEISKSQLVSYIERLVVLSVRPDEAIFKMVISPEEFALEALNQDYGSTDIKVADYKFEGEKIEIIVSSKLIIEGLKSFSSDLINIYFIDGRNVVLFTHDSDKLRYLLSPLTVE